MADLEPRSPEWWVERLAKKMNDRRDPLAKARRYYEGEHNLAFATKKFQEAFGGLFKEFADNWCGVVVQAPAERLKPQGIRIGTEPLRRGRLPDPEVYDRDAWEIWQRNELDAEAHKNHTEILSTGYGYVIVWVGEDEEPVITVEDPLQVIVEYEPEFPRQRAAALKRWRDDWTGFEHATLYLPDGLYKYKSAQKLDALDQSSEAVKWEKRDVEGEDWPLANPLERVPVVEFTNDTSVRGEGRSEIAQVIPVQNAINKTITDMMVASEFLAFPQRAILGWTPENDPESGQSETESLKVLADRIMTFQDKEVKLAEWTQARLEGHIKAVEMFVLHVAARTRTPRHYLIQMGQSPSGDAIKSAETGLVAKVGERATEYGERWEEVIRLGFAVKDDSKANATSSEMLWGDPEYRTEGELTDAIIKQVQANLITWRAAVERLGYSPQEIDRMAETRKEEAAAAAEEPDPATEPAPAA